MSHRMRNSIAVVVALGAVACGKGSMGSNDGGGGAGGSGGSGGNASGGASGGSGGGSAPVNCQTVLQFPQVTKVTTVGSVMLNAPSTIRVDYEDPLDGGVSVTIDAPPAYLDIGGAMPPYTATSHGGRLDVGATFKNPISLVQVRVVDTCSHEATLSETLSIDNRPPMFTTPLPAQLGTLGPGKSLALFAEATDPDPSEANALTWEFSASPADAGVMGPADGGEPNRAVFTASNAYAGAVTVSARVTDPRGLSATSSAQLTVVNLAPVFTNGVQGPASTFRGGAATLTAVADDPEGDAVQYFWTFGGDAGGSFSAPVGQWTAASTGTFTAGTSMGAVAVTVKARDPLLAESAPATVSFPVVNRPPTLAVPMLDGGSVKRSGALVLNALIVDPDGDRVWTAWTTDGGGTIISDGGATATFTAGGVFGNSNITVTATDEFDASVTLADSLAVGAWRTLGDAGFSRTGVSWPQLAFDSTNTAWVAYHPAFTADGGDVAVRRFQTDAGWVPVGPAGVSAPFGVAFDLQSNQPVLGSVTSSKVIAVHRFDGGSWTELLGPTGSGQRVGSSQARLSMTTGPSGPVVAFRNASVPGVVSRAWNGTAWQDFPVANGGNVIGYDGWDVNIVRDSTGAWLLGLEDLPSGSGTKSMMVLTLGNASGSWPTPNPFTVQRSGVVTSSLTSGASGSYLAYPVSGGTIVYKNTPGSMVWSQVGSTVKFELAGTFGASTALADDGTALWMTGYSSAGVEVMRYDVGRARWERFGPQGRGSGAAYLPPAPIVIDKTGAPCVAFYDAPNGGLTVQCAE